MSIWSAAAPEPHVSYLIVALLTLGGIGASIQMRVWRWRSIEGPPRLPRNAVRPVLFILLAGLGSLFVSQILYLAVRGVDHSDELTVIDWAVLAVVPGLVVFVTVVTAHRLMRGEIGAEIGYHRRHILPGALIGVVATLVVFPLMYWFLAAMELFYRWIEYEHPQEHDLLRLMGEVDDPLVITMLVFGAVVVAPLWEEFVFRGHVQSLLVGIFSGRGRSVCDAPPDAQAAPSPAPPQQDGPVLEYRSPTTIIPRYPTVWARWFAVGLTSAVFAAIHPPWTAPAIFLLSMCLGYVYERSGNLWACVVLHGLFNLSNTLLFLTTA